MPDDSYVPGKGKIIKEREANDLKFNLNNSDTEFMIDEETGNLKTKVNWMEDTKKAIDIMNNDDGQSLPGGFNSEDLIAKSPITPEQRVEALKEFESVENDITRIQVPEQTICNQKEGKYCDGFKWLIRGDTVAAHIEDWGGEKQVWVCYVLTNPELEYANHINVASMDDITKTRFTMPFRVRKMILKHCSHCGGSLEF